MDQDTSKKEQTTKNAKRSLEKAQVCSSKKFFNFYLPYRDMRQETHL